MQPSCHLHILRAEPGAVQRNVLDDGPQRCNGRPGFLLEPDASECYPFGESLLREADRRAQLPGGPLCYRFDDGDESFTERAVALALPFADACSEADALAVVCAHSCLSEDVSTCLTSRVIDSLGLHAIHSFTVLGEPGSAWAQALECAQALQHGDGAARTTLLLAGEKWRAPFHRHYGDLFAMSDGMAATLVSAQAPARGRSLAVRASASCAGDGDAPWLHAPVPVDALAWARIVEAGLARIEQRLGLDLRAPGVACLGPVLGVSAADLRGVAPRLAALVEGRAGADTPAGHFGAADPFIRLAGWLEEAQPRARVLAWSAGPAGDVSALHGEVSA